MQIMEVPSLLQEGSTGVKRNILKHKQEQQVRPLGGCCSWPASMERPHSIRRLWLLMSARGGHCEEDEFGLFLDHFEHKSCMFTLPFSFFRPSFSVISYSLSCSHAINQWVPSVSPSPNTGSWLCIFPWISFLLFHLVCWIACHWTKHICLSLILSIPLFTSFRPFCGSLTSTVSERNYGKCHTMIPSSNIFILLHVSHLTNSLMAITGLTCDPTCK